MKLSTKYQPYWMVLTILLLILINGAPSVHAGLALQPTETATPNPQMGSMNKGVILELPEGASQLEIGKEAYRLICSACHAYDGSGLTAEWRSTWAEEDQNCWQSKCHGYNHPEDGFYLPESPPVVGSFVPYLFPNAQKMYDYIFKNMPWHDPGSLRPEVAWALTAHVLSLNGYKDIPELNAENGASFILQIPTTATSAAHLPTEQPTPQPSVTAQATLANTASPAQTEHKGNLGWVLAGLIALLAGVYGGYKLRKS